MTEEHMRAILKSTIAHVISDTYEREFAIQELFEMGFSEEDIRHFGYDWLFEVE